MGLARLPHGPQRCSAVNNGAERSGARRKRRPGSQLTPAQKMERMQLWFEQNEGAPLRGDNSLGFDARGFWDSCCSGRVRGGPVRRRLGGNVDRGHACVVATLVCDHVNFDMLRLPETLPPGPRAACGPRGSSPPRARAASSAG